MDARGNYKTSGKRKRGWERGGYNVVLLCLYSPLPKEDLHSIFVGPPAPELVPHSADWGGPFII